MNKQQFLDALRRGLSQLPEEEIEKQTSYYSELIDDMAEDGTSEWEATERLGSVQEIYENILQDMPLPLLVRTKAKPRGGWTAITVILVILGFPIWFSLAVALFAVVLAVYASLWAVGISVFAAALAIIICAVALAAFFHTAFHKRCRRCTGHGCRTCSGGHRPPAGHWRFLSMQGHS